MKLKDPDRVRRVMDAKLDELHESRKRFPMLPGKEVAEIYEQETAIIHIAVHIHRAIKRPWLLRGGRHGACL